MKDEVDDDFLRIMKMNEIIEIKLSFVITWSARWISLKIRKGFLEDYMGKWLRIFRREDDFLGIMEIK